MRIGYRVVERFSPALGERWTSYVKWSGLSHLTEVVGLDCGLCPSVIREFSEQDMDQLVFAEHVYACFGDQEYSFRRTRDVFDRKLHQILAIAREPAPEEVFETDIRGFRFMGFELIDEDTEISALTNCGGFEGSFVSMDLAPCGLVPLASRAYEIRRSLRTLFPEEEHADCAVWAIWRQDAAQANAADPSPPRR